MKYSLILTFIVVTHCSYASFEQRIEKMAAIIKTDVERSMHQYPLQTAGGALTTAATFAKLILKSKTSFKSACIIAALAGYGATSFSKKCTQIAKTF